MKSNRYTKVISKIIALFLAIIVLIPSLPAMALSVGDKSAYTENGLGGKAHYDTGRWETADGHVHDNRGQVYLRNLKSTGEPIYCIQIYEKCEGTTTTAKSIKDTSVWLDEYSTTAQKIVTRVSIWGYPNFTYGYSAQDAQLATQVLIWEAEISARTNYDAKVTPFAENIFTNFSGARACYLEILKACQNHSSGPTFNATSVKLEDIGFENAVTLTDTNGVLSNFEVSTNSDIVKASISGNTVNIWATKAEDTNATITFTKKSTDINSALALTGANQLLFYGTIADPVQASISVTVEAKGSCKIVKTSEDGNVSGLSFTITGNGVDKTVTTGSDGTVTINDLRVGTYTVTEASYDKYVAQSSKTVTVTSGNTTTVNFSNILKKFNVVVTKTDIEKESSQGDATLAGAVYGVYKSGELLDEYTIGENGTFTTKYYTCDSDYTVKEISASEGYLVNESSYSLSAEASNFTSEYNTVNLTVTEQVEKGNIAIIKHTDDGSTKIEVPEVGAQFQVYLKSAGSYSNADEDERDTITCDTAGFAITKDLPYGVYTVHQTKTWEGREMMSDFDVYVSEDGKTYQYLINNAIFESYIKIVKTDEETGKQIAYAGAGFQIIDPDGNLVTMSYTYPTPTTIDTFYTNSEGYLVTPETLSYGKGYSVVEVQAPYGYVLDSTPIKFDVTSTNSKQENALTVIEVNRQNIAQKGVIEISKTGEVFATVLKSENIYSPVYQVQGLKDATYEIYAAEDIVTLDDTIRYEKGFLVDVVTTNNNGIAKSKELYLGKYIVKETTAPYGYALDKNVHEVTLTYAGQEISVTSTSLAVSDVRQKAIISLTKILEQDELFGIGNNNEISKVQFGVFAAEDVTAKDGTVIRKDGLVTTSYCDANGNISFECDLPIGYEWYVKELETDEHYSLSDTKYSFSTEYRGQEIEVYDIEINDGEPINNEIIRGTIVGKKIDTDGFTIYGTIFGLFNGNETEFSAENALATSQSNEIGIFCFENVPYGDWIVRELKASPAFVNDESNHLVTIEEDEQIFEMTVENEFLLGSVQVTKVDAQYPENKLSGATFEVYVDVDGNKEFDAEIDLFVDELNEIEAGIYQLDNLRYNGYFLYEKTAPEGFLKDDNYYYFEIRTNEEIVLVENEAGVGFINQPIIGKVDILKTDKDTNEPLKGVGFRVLDEAGNIISEAYTDEYGVVAFELRYGKYTIVEFDALDGYYDNTEVYNIEITEDGQVIDIEITNQLIPIELPKAGTQISLATLFTGVLVSAVGFIISRKLRIKKTK